MSLNSQKNRDQRKTKEAAKDRLRQAERMTRQFYVGIGKDQQVVGFTNPDGIVITYAAVGPLNVCAKLRQHIKVEQGQNIDIAPISRSNFYLAAMVRLPATGTGILGLIHKNGIENIPLTPFGAAWLRKHNYMIPELGDEMETLLYTAKRIATNEYDRPFTDLREISAILPNAIIEGMANVVANKPAGDLPMDVPEVLESVDSYR